MKRGLPTSPHSSLVPPFCSVFRLAGPYILYLSLGADPLGLCRLCLARRRMRKTVYHRSHLTADVITLPSFPLHVRSV